MLRRKIVTPRGSNNSGIISKFIVYIFQLHQQNFVSRKQNNAPKRGICNTREKKLAY